MIKKIFNNFKNNKKEPTIDTTVRTGFGSVWILFNRFFWKSFMGPFFSFAFVVLIYFILGSVMGYKIMFPGIASMSALSTGITAMPNAILELKQSVLLKRIGASPVKPITFTLVIISYYIMIVLLSVLWLMLWALILTQDTSVFGPLGTIVGFFGFLYGNLLGIIVSLTLGFMISSFAKSPQSAQAIGMTVYFPCVFLSGQFLAPSIISSNETMLWISRLIPFRYTTMITSEAWQGSGLKDIVHHTTAGSPHFTWTTVAGNPFSIHDYGIPKELKLTLNDLVKKDPMKDISSKFKAIIVWNKTDHIIGYIYPFISIFLCTTISIKKFKWSSSR